MQRPSELNTIFRGFEKEFKNNLDLPGRTYSTPSILQLIGKDVELSRCRQTGRCLGGSGGKRMLEMGWGEFIRSAAAQTVLSRSTRANIHLAV